jgi:predicted sulfurtransferase
MEVNDNVKYFVIDCRSENETKCGKFGSAFWIDPKKIVDDENVRSTVLESLEALRGQVMFHYCY